MNTALASFNTTVRQITEMFLRKKTAGRVAYLANNKCSFTTSPNNSYCPSTVMLTVDSILTTSWLRD